jgi:hypothetical protein
MQIITAFGRTLVSEGSETMQSIAITVSSKSAGRNPTVVPSQQRTFFLNSETVKHKSMESTTWRHTLHRFTVFSAD